MKKREISKSHTEFRDGMLSRLDLYLEDTKLAHRKSFAVGSRQFQTMPFLDADKGQ